MTINHSCPEAVANTQALVENDSGTFLVRLRRPDGSVHLMRVPNEHFDRIVALAAGEFGDKSIEEIGKRGG